MDEQQHAPPSDRVTLRRRRGARRASTTRRSVRAILDAGVIAHVGVPTDDGPIVLPMAYGRTDDTLYLHGSAANSMLRTARSMDICATVTLLDGLIFARSPFHNSMNYRSVVIRGIGTPVDDPAEHMDALRLITDHVVANWDHGRTPTATEIKQDDGHRASARRGRRPRCEPVDPIDEPEDLDGGNWAGTVALRQTWGPAARAPTSVPGIAAPATIAEAFGG